MATAPALNDDQTSWHHVVFAHAFHNTMSALPTCLPKPTVLLLGEIVIAHAEWESLAAIAELRVSTGLKREMQFLFSMWFYHTRI